MQTLAEMTPGMVLDVMVQKVLEDGSVVFSGHVPDLILKASRYHRAGEFAHHGLLGDPGLNCCLCWVQSFRGHIVMS